MVTQALEVSYKAAPLQTPKASLDTQVPKILEPPKPRTLRAPNPKPKPETLKTIQAPTRISGTHHVDFTQAHVGRSFVEQRDSLSAKGEVCMVSVCMCIYIYTYLIYIYVSIYTHVYIYTYTCTCTCACTCTYTDTFTYTYKVYIYIYLHTYIYLYGSLFSICWGVGLG